MTLEKNVRGYVGIAGQLQRDILGGALPPGSKLPSERELSGRFGASRVTIRRALRSLEDGRLIVRRHGSGTYVALRADRRIPVMMDYTASMRDHAPGLERCLLLWRRDSADTFAADRLNLDEGAEVLYAERVDSLGDQPVAWDRAYIAASFTRNLAEEHLARVDFVEIWSKVCGFRIESCRQTIEAVAADGATCQLLNLRRGRPVLRSTELYITLRERPAGLFVSYYHPSHICIASRCQWSEAATRKPAKGRTQR